MASLKRLDISGVYVSVCEAWQRAAKQIDGVRGVFEPQVLGQVGFGHRDASSICDGFKVDVENYAITLW